MVKKELKGSDLFTCAWVSLVVVDVLVILSSVSLLLRDNGVNQRQFEAIVGMSRNPSPPVNWFGGRDPCQNQMYKGREHAVCP
jgi:hypothetical protein